MWTYIVANIVENDTTVLKTFDNKEDALEFGKKEWDTGKYKGCVSVFYSEMDKDGNLNEYAVRKVYKTFYNLKAVMSWKKG